MLTRRELMQAAAAAALTPLSGRAAEAASFCLFSKHLPDLGWSDLGRAVKDAGFDGVDLTVRAKGHVLPERATADLPRAIEAVRSHGLTVPMVTTELTSAKDPLARPLLQTAAKGGVRYFKTGYWYWSASSDVRAQLAAVGDALAGLAELGKECGIELGFHNHNGYVGAALWDIAPAIDKLDPKWAGYYFDPRHAVAEGGGGSWKAAAHLVAPRLKMIALKDFYWEKTPKGWAIQNCPMGDGAVDWTSMARIVQEARFAGPISLHLDTRFRGRPPRSGPRGRSRRR